MGNATEEFTLGIFRAINQLQRDAMSNSYQEFNAREKSWFDKFRKNGYGPEYESRRKVYLEKINREVAENIAAKNPQYMKCQENLSNLRDLYLEQEYMERPIFPWAEMEMVLRIFDIRLSNELIPLQIKSAPDSQVKYFRDIYSLILHAFERQDLSEIFFSPNTRMKENESADCPLEVKALFVEIDYRNRPGKQGQAMEEIEKFPLPPTLKTWVGTRYQIFWALATPISLGGDTAGRALMNSYFKRLADAFGATAFRVDSLINLPGSCSISEPDSPSIVDVLGCWGDRKYRLHHFDQVLKHLPSPKVSPKALPWVPEFVR